MKVLSIDQSFTNCAYIVWENGLIYDYGVIQTSKDFGDEIDRLALIVAEVGNILVNEQIEHLVLEGLSLGGVSNSTRILAGLYYSLLLKAYNLAIDYSVVAPTSVKKHATGSGRAKKPDMWASLPDKIKEKFEKTHKSIASGRYDLTDAYFIGTYYYEMTERG